MPGSEPLLTRVKTRPPVDYSVCYPGHLIEHLAENVIRGCERLGLKKFDERTGHSVEVVSLMETGTPDTHQSVYREHLIEHLLIGELLKHSWLHHAADLEISKPELDRAGHDIILEAHGFTRHVQLKSSFRGARTARQKVHVDLAEKPSGCVIWVHFDPETLEMGPFLFFGSEPGAKMPPMEAFPVARHTKGNALGIKTERPNLRVVARGRFQKTLAWV